jgi:hypothetical protein
MRASINILKPLTAALALAQPMTSAWGADVQASAGSTNAAAPAPPGVAAAMDRALDFKKPAWLTDLSVGVKQSYDDNIYLSGVSGRFLPPTYEVPPGSVAALKNVASWVTTVSPKVGVNLAPVIGVENIDNLSLNYAPDFVNYYEAQSENYNAQRFGTTIKAHAGAFSLALENSLFYIDGDNVAPTYPGAMYSAIGIAAPRERREQVQDRSNIALRYDGSWWFIRPTASLLAYDMKTELINVVGYQNYCDRYDVNGGADFGWKVLPKSAVTLGYRYGYQYQQQFSFSPYSSPSHYQRLLVGFEGNPWTWLDVKIAAGPDFRDYPGDTLTHITPVNDKTPVKFYGESSITAKVSAKDSLIFKSKQFQWVSSIGKVPYYDSIVDLGYHRVLTSKLSADLGGRLWIADYASGNLPACKRDDWQYTVQAGLTYNFNTHLVANVAYALNLGRNAQENVVDPQTREYNQNLVSMGLLLKF